MGQRKSKRKAREKKKEEAEEDSSLAASRTALTVHSVHDVRSCSVTRLDRHFAPASEQHEAFSRTVTVRGDRLELELGAARRYTETSTKGNSSLPWPPSSPPRHILIIVSDSSLPRPGAGGTWAPARAVVNLTCIARYSAVAPCPFALVLDCRQRH